MIQFSDRLADAIDKAGSPACVGLDPVFEKLPEELRRGAPSPPAAIERFCLGVLDEVAGIVPVVKPQSACFERYGSAGVAVLERVIVAARERSLLVVLDAKRGDIGVTAEHYAVAAFGDENNPQPCPHAADALTLSGYLGADTLTPLMRPGHGVFVLVRTSNPGSDATQAHRLADGRSVAVMIADMVVQLGKERMGRRGLSDVGAVVGATKASEGRELRERMPNQVFLVPGYGAQGGTIDDVRQLVRTCARSMGELGVLVNASRSVIFPAASPGKDWKSGVREAAKKFAGELAALRS